MKRNAAAALVMGALLCALTPACDQAEKDTASEDDARDEDLRESKKKKKKSKKGGKAEPDDGWEKGGEVAVQFKLSAADVTDLACAMKGDVDGLRCAFKAPDEEASTTDVRSNDTILQPFTTVDGRRVLVAGVWLMPDVKTHMAANTTRFLATCTLIPAAVAKDVKIRTFPKAPWTAAEGQWVTRARVCTVAGAPSPKLPTIAPSPSPDARTYVPVASYSPRLGPEHAKVTILKFTDYQ